jgi:hypothetical protein
MFALKKSINYIWYETSHVQHVRQSFIVSIKLFAIKFALKATSLIKEKNRGGE